MSFGVAQLGKYLPCNAWDPGLILGSRRSPSGRDRIPASVFLECRRPQFDYWVGKILWGRDRLPTPVFLVFPGGSADKESTCKVGVLGSIPGLGRSPGEGHGNPLYYSGLENPHRQRSLVAHCPWGCRVGHNLVTIQSIYILHLKLL